MDIFKFSSFRPYIRAHIDHNAAVRGYHGKLATAARCQSSYLSRVLVEKASLNSDQAMRLAMFWDLGERETDYFLLLVDLDKTTFGPMRDRIKGKLNRLREVSKELAPRLQKTENLDSFHAEVYYSSWQWIAIHLLVGIDGYRNSAAIAQRLNLPPEHVEHILQRLSSMKLIESTPTGWRLKDTHLHLPPQSPFTTLNHMNWRYKALTDASIRTSDNLHYTCIQTHSIDDVYKIRDLMLDTISKLHATTRVSRNEEMTCLCLDFFKV